MSNHKIELIQFLNDEGFKVDLDPVLGNTELTAYKTFDVNAKECMCNDRVPQITIEYHLMRMGATTREIEGLTVKLCGQSNVGWVDFSVYGLDYEDLKERLSIIVSSLYDSWNASWVE